MQYKKRYYNGQDVTPAGESSMTWPCVCWSDSLQREQRREKRKKGHRKSMIGVSNMIMTTQELSDTTSDRRNKRGNVIVPLLNFQFEAGKRHKEIDEQRTVLYQKWYYSQTGPNTIANQAFTH